MMILHDIKKKQYNLQKISLIPKKRVPEGLYWKTSTIANKVFFAPF